MPQLFDSTQPYVFVTVGTTSFDTLIQEITSPLCLQDLANRNIYQLLIQFGRGTTDPSSSLFLEQLHSRWREFIQKGEQAELLQSPTKTSSLQKQTKTQNQALNKTQTKTQNQSQEFPFIIHSYNFKPSLLEDMMNATLVVSHGGIFKK